ncbi:NADH-ubiquinone oxidoreductase-F iron-sulfur binding region domain-containing protein [Acetobacterium woodii]|uniref:NADH-quinone oxidoreductase subunit F n=1 Tax=Acetobacterium woodii (strain ATCC 29683 / DSM 1030 / JCM 2381 / KCTC 1655 / WB1) TaxID=931626 RepID=H6LDJ1_ACEWD|nr:NADH-ubiquinone oxidoreductase-F iron-sulfur binding region domain-containing protein [Acetobacterium woodii]AFA47963.1 NADH-quinone oxidoreductase subunit F [Acetobacterium woodii DSM 1030]
MKHELNINNAATRVVTKKWGRMSGNNIAEYINLGGFSGLEKVLKLKPEDVIKRIEVSGLRGKGGAGYPAGLKWRCCAGQTGEKYIVSNFSNCDNTNMIVNAMIHNDVYSAIEGIMIAGYAIGADSGIIFLRNTQAVEYNIIRAALEQMRSSKILGKGILKSDFQFDIQVVMGKNNAEKGQEIIILRSLEGLSPVTVCNRPHSAEAGLNGKPTLYHSMETLASVPAILEEGYIETKIVQLIDTENDITLITEVAIGSSIGDVLEREGIPTEGIKAFSFGESMGAIFPPDRLGILLDFDGINNAGGAFGNAVIRILREKECLVDRVMRCYEVSSVECCGRCVFGRMGTAQIYETLKDITKKRGKADDLDCMREIAEAMLLVSSCNQGKCAAQMILSALDFFQNEFDMHIRRKTCEAQVCKGYLSYYISPEACDGCGKCLSVCQRDAIEGEDDYIHVLVHDMCDSCADCVSICPNKAIRIVGESTPKIPDSPIPVGSWKQSRRRR